MPGFDGVSCADLRIEGKHRETAEQEHGAEAYVLAEDTNGWMDGWMDGQTDEGWAKGWADGWMDGQMNRRTKEQTTGRHRKALINA